MFLAGATDAIGSRSVPPCRAGTPAELRISYMPADIAEGTPLADSETLDGSWLPLIAQHTGRRVIANVDIDTRLIGPGWLKCHLTIIFQPAC